MQPLQKHSSLGRQMQKQDCLLLERGGCANKPNQLPSVRLLQPKRRVLCVCLGISLYFLAIELYKKHLLPVSCSQVATAEAPQESSNPINRHNEGPQQHDCLRMEGRAMSLYPGFINKLPDVLKKKMRFDWIMGIKSHY